MPLLGDMQLQMEPVTQLSKLKNLGLVATPIATPEGQLLFQPLTGLTSLNLRPGRQPFGPKGRTLEVRMLSTYVGFCDCIHVDDTGCCDAFATLDTSAVRYRSLGRYRIYNLEHFLQLGIACHRTQSACSAKGPDKHDKIDRAGYELRIWSTP